jgi:hypothetical protein
MSHAGCLMRFFTTKVAPISSPDQGGGKRQAATAPLKRERWADLPNPFDPQAFVRVSIQTGGQGRTTRWGAEATFLVPRTRPVRSYLRLTFD